MCLRWPVTGSRAAHDYSLETEPLCGKPVISFTDRHNPRPWSKRLSHLKGQAREGRCAQPQPCSDMAWVVSIFHKSSDINYGRG